MYRIKFQGNNNKFDIKREFTEKSKNKAYDKIKQDQMQLYQRLFVI
jgi:hypothetical protein